MHTFLRSLFTVLTLFSLVLIGAACGGSDTSEPAAGDVAGAAASSTPAAKAGAGNAAEPTEGSMPSPEAAAMMAKYREMAAQEGIYFGEVPEGFPTDIIPVHPDGAIDKSSTGNGDFTLLQVVDRDKDSTISWFRDHYKGLGFNVNDPVTVMGRTMVTGGGPAGELSLTFIDREEGKTFVAQVMSPR